jgi:pseudouridine-5'-phosphate glycosidase/pseudouridine kinase
VAINDSGKDLVLAMSDMDIFTQHPIPQQRKEEMISGSRARWVVVDGNWTEADIRAWIRTCKLHGSRVAFEPVSVAKAKRLFGKLAGLPEHGLLDVFPRAGVDMATPNTFELAAMHSAARQNGYFDRPDWFEVIDAFGMRGGARDAFVRLTSRDMTDAGVPVQSVQLLPFVPTVVTKLGPQGVLVTSILARGDSRLDDSTSAPYILARSAASNGGDVGGVYMRLFPPGETVESAHVVSVNGVGDTFVGVLVAGLAMGSGDGVVVDERLVNVAQRAARMTLRSMESVSGRVADLGKELQ